MIAKILAKIFGTQNERELRSLYPLVSHINDFEASIKALSDAELAAKTNQFRERLSRGASLDAILPEAFAMQAGLHLCRLQLCRHQRPNHPGHLSC